MTDQNEEPQDVSDDEVDAFAAKLNAFADGLEPRERAMLDELLTLSGEGGEDDEVSGFAFGDGLDLGLDFLRGGTIGGMEGATAYNRWNRTTKPDPDPWRRWNRTTKITG